MPNPNDICARPGCGHRRDEHYLRYECCAECQRERRAHACPGFVEPEAVSEERCPTCGGEYGEQTVVRNSKSASGFSGCPDEFHLLPRRDERPEERWLTQRFDGGPEADPSEHGDCFRACVCSILHLPLDALDSPSPELDYDEWERLWQEQLGRHGFYCFGFEAPLWFEPPGYWLASVPSLNLPPDENGVIRHSVVMRGGKLVHDPARHKRYERVGMEDILSARFLVPLDPSSLQAANQKVEALEKECKKRGLPVSATALAKHERNSGALEAAFTLMAEHRQALTSLVEELEERADLYEKDGEAGPLNCWGWRKIAQELRSAAEAVRRG